MKQVPTFYLTNDPLRALGYENQLKNFHIICIDYTDVVDQLRKAGIPILCFEKDIGGQNELPRNTRMLMLHPVVQKYIIDNSNNDVDILMFKPNFSLIHALKDSPLTQQRTLRSLNNLPSLTTKLENKFFFKKFCDYHQLTTIPSQQIDLHALSYKQISATVATHFVVQFDRGWFGNHTFFISSEKDLKKIQEKYTDREVKIAPYIIGTTLTNNAVVREGITYQSYPFLQINDLPDAEVTLARLQGSTIGNAWVPTEKLPVSDPVRVVSEIKKITEKIGGHIFELGYKGYFGLDFIVDKQNHVFVQEINARFTASTQMYTYLELDAFQDSLYRQHLVAFNMDHLMGETTQDYFQPVFASRILARHTDTQPAVLNHAFQNGKYRLDRGTVTYTGEEYDIRKLNNNEVLIFTAASGREITVDQEVLQIQSKFHTVDEIISLARTLKSQIDLSPIQ